MSTKLLNDIEEFLSETGMSAYTFGFEAVRNGRLVERLRMGRRVWPETQAEIRAFMRVERSKRISKRQRKNARAA
ncbi:hypothetical protein ACFOLL_13105 [Falsochrobactrum ovis]|uniref:hypothetical protein n=1 Tax=Falsochrobactrum ovis TaxID=1293442 RepID=UPI000DB9C313|nr:hypothetical protein [Falsochrobactrum ovis]